MAKSRRSRSSAAASGGSRSESGPAASPHPPLPDSLRAEPLPSDVTASDSYVPPSDQVPRSSLGDIRAEEPLGTAFWTLQFAQAVSLTADGGLLWSLVFWTSGDGKSSGVPLTSVVSPALQMSLWLLPLIGLLGDRLSRKALLMASLGLRAVAQLAIALLLVTKQLGPSALFGCQIASLIGTLLFEVTCPATVPMLVTQPQAPRALGYGLSLPRAGFFLTSVVCLLMVAIIGPVAMLLTGVGFLALALDLLRRLGISTEPANPWPLSAAPRRLFDAIGLLLRTPGLAWLGFLAALANFVVYPLFALSPYQRLHPQTHPQAIAPGGMALLTTLLPSTPPPQEQHDLEFWLVIGVVIGAALLQRRLKAVSTDRIFAASLLWLALGVGLLAISSSEAVAVLATILVGVALMPLAALSTGVSLLGVASEYRARVAALLAMLFLLGGELGQAVLRPLLIQHGQRPIMMLLAIGLLVLGMALLSVEPLPRFLRSPERH